MKQQIRAIFFDLDDTLCAYWSASRRGLRQAFEEAPLECDPDKAIEAWRNVFSTFSPEIKTDSWYERYLESGEPTRTEHMRRVLTSLGCPSDQLATKLSARYAELRDASLEPFQETHEVLEFLKSKYILGLITNGPADVQRQEIETLGIGEYFDHILIEGEYKLGKPHQEIFDEARRLSGFEHDEMLFVGNAFEHDVQGSKNAGWHSIWVNKAMETNPGSGPQPDAVAFNLWEVVDWLGHERPAYADNPEIEGSKAVAKNWRR
ncbi:MAG: HAD family hydrolase [Armatimonadetes bacterium]|nr:HAD family hydrolase [Armatimonadota bacterium]